MMPYVTESPSPVPRVLALLGCRLGSEERIVNALNVFRRDARAGVGDSNAHHLAIRRGHAQFATARHRIFGVQKKIEEYLLQPARISLNRRDPGRQFSLHLESWPS